MILRIAALLLLTVSLVYCGSYSTAKSKVFEITVSAGAVDRRDSIVSFPMPAEAPGDLYELRDERGQSQPLAIDKSRNATFILRSQPAGTSKSFTLVKSKPKPTGPNTGVELVDSAAGINVTLNGRKVLSFVGKPSSLPDPGIKPVFLRGGYLHPVYTPLGRLVTDDYPSDHYHHHGIWFAWTKTKFGDAHPDFWNVDDGTGRIDFGASEITGRGPVYGALSSRQFYIALNGSAATNALTEHWDVRVYNVGQQGSSKYFLFDLTATQETATTVPLKLEEYRYGGMGLRGHRDWKDKSKVSFLTSEGKTRENGNATRGRWFVMSGPVEGATVNIAVLDHPGNFRSPQPMRLNPDDPFFNYAPSQLGPFEITPGSPFVLRYRYVVSDGPPDSTELDRLWNELSNPPQVSIRQR